MQHKCCIGQVDVLLTCNKKKYLQYFRFCIRESKKCYQGASPQQSFIILQRLKIPAQVGSTLAFGKQRARPSSVVCFLKHHQHPYGKQLGQLRYLMAKQWLNHIGLYHWTVLLLPRFLTEEHFPWSMSCEIFSLLILARAWRRLWRLIRSNKGSARGWGLVIPGVLL